MLPTQKSLKTSRGIWIINSIVNVINENYLPLKQVLLVQYKKNCQCPRGPFYFYEAIQRVDRPTTQVNQDDRTTQEDYQRLRGTISHNILWSRPDALQELPLPENPTNTLPAA